ncbi:hypothetical protein A8F94_10875 [Bacillus sp. FJAT-27225]|uniref:glycosyltransferase family 2 protein n=1 Tax=Bacillus sp. FJAT-27225 TaxID=1743144 RepID=UPI00080C20E8|nr:glycosyltransferase family A protein [Bacillus sp. FJAT-27225]OCA88293.1 hypothetical protein A8F94_10875 [Bacillus sp. FJAT-27225]
MVEPKISIIVPTYNSELTIEKCLSSILEQTYNDFEIIIIDDGSKDQSAKKAEDILNGINVKYTIIKKKNGGASSARNKGLEIAKGEYIAFLDSDDQWLPEKLAESIDAIEKNKDVVIVSNLASDTKTTSLYTKVSFNKLLYKNYFFTSSVLVKKSVLDDRKLRFNESLPGAEDYDMWLNILKGNQGIVINKKLFVYGDDKRMFGVSGLSRDIYTMQKCLYRIYNSLYKGNHINMGQYFLVSFYSTLKFLRRFLIVKLFD